MVFVFRLLNDPESLIHAMLRPRLLTLPGHIQGVFLQNLMKVFAVCLSKAEKDVDWERAGALTKILLDRVPDLVQSSNLEVQERVGI